MRLAKGHVDVGDGLSHAGPRKQGLKRGLEILFVHTRAAEPGVHGDLALEGIRQGIDAFAGEIPLKPAPGMARRAEARVFRGQGPFPSGFFHGCSIYCRVRCLS